VGVVLVVVSLVVGKRVIGEALTDFRNESTIHWTYTGTSFSKHSTNREPFNSTLDGAVWESNMTLLEYGIVSKPLIGGSG